MSTTFNKSQFRTQFWYVVLMIVISMATIMLIFARHSSAAEATAVYLPLVQTSSRDMTPPTGVYKSISLPGAKCPNDLSINMHSRKIYITNERSDTVSVLHNQQFVENIPAGNWPIYVRSDPFSDNVYVTHVLGNIVLLDSNGPKAAIQPYSEAYYITINPLNGYTYITDLHRPITILQGAERITDLFVPKFEGFQIEWQLAVDYDKLTGLTYFASWQKGIMSVVDGTEVVDQFRYYGGGGKDMVIDAHRGLIYVANIRAGEDDEPENNISIIDMETKGVRQIYTSRQSAHLALDPTSGYVYVTNPIDSSVTVLRGKNVINTYIVDEEPWAVTVDPQTGYAYVTSRQNNSVTIFKDAQLIDKISLPTDGGFNPWQVTIDPQTHDVYVLQRSSITKDTGPEECRQPWVHILR